MAFIDMMHPGMVIAHVDADAGLFITWNGSATFRVFRTDTTDSDRAEHIEEVDVFTNDSAAPTGAIVSMGAQIDRAVKIAGDWYKAQQAEAD